MAVDAIVSCPLGDLKLWDKNPRLITKERFDSLKKSMEADPEMLQARPLIALRDGRVIAGNMRLRAALELNWETIPVVYVDLSEDEAVTWALRDNNPYGEYDDQGLAELLYALQESDIDLDLTGFSVDDVARIFEGAPPPEDPGLDDRGSALALADVTIDDPKHIVSKGEKWRVGRHTLVCSGVYDGWQEWADLLDGEVLFVPYPTPAVPLAGKALTTTLVMVQPDPWMAGQLVDKYAAVHGENEVGVIE